MKDPRETEDCIFLYEGSDCSIEEHECGWTSHISDDGTELVQTRICQYGITPEDLNIIRIIVKRARAD